MAEQLLNRELDPCVDLHLLVTQRPRHNLFKLKEHQAGQEVVRLICTLTHNHSAEPLSGQVSDVKINISKLLEEQLPELKLPLVELICFRSCRVWGSKLEEERMDDDSIVEGL